MFTTTSRRPSFLSNVSDPQASLPSNLDAEMVRRGRAASLEVLEAEMRRLRSSVEEASGQESVLAAKRRKLAEAKEAMKLTENVMAALTTELKRCRDDVVDQVDEGVTGARKRHRIGGSSNPPMPHHFCLNSKPVGMRKQSYS